jgi:hypothetical protein
LQEPPKFSQNGIFGLKITIWQPRVQLKMGPLNLAPELNQCDRKIFKKLQKNFKIHPKYQALHT